MYSEISLSDIPACKASAWHPHQPHPPIAFWVLEMTETFNTLFTSTFADIHSEEIFALDV